MAAAGPGGQGAHPVQRPHGGARKRAVSRNGACVVFWVRGVGQGMHGDTHKQAVLRVIVRVWCPDQVLGASGAQGAHGGVHGNGPCRVQWRMYDALLKG